MVKAIIISLVIIIFTIGYIIKHMHSNKSMILKIHNRIANIYDHSEKDILCNCIENYIELANNNSNTLNDYYYIITFIYILKEQYKEYNLDFDKYIQLFEKKGILNEYKKNPNNLLKKYYQNYNINPQKAQEIQYGYIEGCPSRYLNFMIAISLCGKPVSSFSRKVLADIYNCNLSIFCKQAIYYNNLFLNNKIYNQSIDKSDKEVKASYYYELATAYERNHDYSNVIASYKIAIKLAPHYVFLYIKFAEFYKRQNKLDNAIKILQNASNTNFYKKDDYFKRTIDRNLRAYKNLKLGIHEHTFPGYDSTNDWNNQKFLQLRKTYKDFFEAHRKLLEDYDFYINKYNNDISNIDLIDKILYIIFEDLKLFPKLLEYYSELQKAGIKSDIIFYGEQYKYFFKSRIKFCENLNKYDEAIKICKLAIKYGFENDGTKSKMQGRIDRLSKKSKMQSS